MTHPSSSKPQSEALTQAELSALLDSVLPGAQVTMRDDTHKHLHHNEMVDHHGAHFFVTIIWDGFTGMPRLARHKLVHNRLEEAWNSRQIHSLSLRLMTADEAVK